MFLALPGWSADMLPAMKAEDIIKKVMETTQSAKSADRRSKYAYTKQVVTEELDGKNQVTDKKEKVYLVQSGFGYLQSMKENGKPVSEAELKKQVKKNLETRQKFTGNKSAKSDDNWENFINSDLTARYQFTLMRQESLNGRPAYVLQFRPLSGNLPVKRLMDRFLNQLTGMVWVDGQEFEIAKADLCIQTKVALGGLLEVVGALKHFQYSVERIRLDEFVWFNRATSGDIEGRKLWDNTHIKTRTQSSDFRKVSPGQSVSLPQEPSAN